MNVSSEVGRLRQVILHRPGTELERLSPDNAANMLFEDVLWVNRAQTEHDSFASVLRSHGIMIHYYTDLLIETLKIPEARNFILNRVIQPRSHGPLAADALRRALGELDAPRLAAYLIGGITKREIGELIPTPMSMVFSALGPEDFVMPPLPNLLYQRDSSYWIYDCVLVSSMRWEARMSEAVLAEAIYRWHPMLAGIGLKTSPSGSTGAPAIEGGDILVLGAGVVLAGMSERTTPQALEMLAQQLFQANAARSLIAIDMPRRRAFMHLDTVLSMVDRGVFIKYEGLGMRPSYTIEPGTSNGDLKITSHLAEDMHATLAAAVGAPNATVLTTNNDVYSQREQWNDSCNVLAVKPGVVIAYERNTSMNAYLCDHGIEVVTVDGSELGRGRGGPRCMTCPIDREA